MREIYHLRFPGKLLFITILSFFFSLKLFANWNISGSMLHLFFAIFILLIFLLLSKPLIIWQRVEIEDGYIIIFKRFFKPIKIKISESLYQIVINGEAIRSFRFRYSKNYYVQVSPIVYKNGNEMSKTVTNYMDKHKIVVEVVGSKV